MADIKDIKNALKTLENQYGFRLVNGEGSRVKVFPPDKNKPFYTAHVNSTTFHPMRRFAEKNWGIILDGK